MKKIEVSIPKLVRTLEENTHLNFISAPLGIYGGNPLGDKYIINMTVERIEKPKTKIEKPTRSEIEKISAAGNVNTNRS